jgi:RHS repeat-associated protein
VLALFGHAQTPCRASATNESGTLHEPSTRTKYTYDAVGNRLSSLGVSPYNVNTSNELTSTPSTTYTYDYNGNTLTKVTGSNTTSYAWDFENRMSSVTLPGTGGTVSFKYDPFGRRIYKSSSSGTSVFAYDGGNLIEETNSTGAVVARYEQTQNIDEPLAMLRSSATSYYHADGLGSINSLSNSAGAIANTYTYDSYGNLTASTGSLVNPFRYTGREFDSETNLYYYRARYYDASTGRFLAEDPISFKGGANFYRYVKNNPVNLVDPFGLNPGAVPWWWWILDNPISIPIITVGAGGAAIIISIGEGILAPATGIDDSRAIPKPRPIPCDKNKRDCAQEWADAYAMCRELLARPHPPRAMTGGYSDLANCARGLVSEECGGNPVGGKKK